MLVKLRGDAFLIFLYYPIKPFTRLTTFWKILPIKSFISLVYINQLFENL